MIWKNLKQKSLADALTIEHTALTELDDVHADWSRLEAQLISITKLLAKRLSSH